MWGKMGGRGHLVSFIIHDIRGSLSTSIESDPKGLCFWVLFLIGHVASMNMMCSECLSTLWSILPYLTADGDFLIAAAAEVMSQIWRHQPTLPAPAQGELLSSLPRLSWPETFF